VNPRTELIESTNTMTPNKSVIDLLQKAVNVVGSEAELARVLGMTPPDISMWKSGKKGCTAADRARLAGIAKEDAVQELVRATLEKYEGSRRGEQLRTLLGKSLHQITVAIGIALLLGASLTYGSFDAGAKVAFFAFFVYSTMYIMLTSICGRSAVPGLRAYAPNQARLQAHTATPFDGRPTSRGASRPHPLS
jgi:DNA-binding transcriptional regulator YdaS (Cro superfamily)